MLQGRRRRRYTQSTSIATRTSSTLHRLSTERLSTGRRRDELQKEKEKLFFTKNTISSRLFVSKDWTPKHKLNFMLDGNTQKKNIRKSSIFTNKPQWMMWKKNKKKLTMMAGCDEKIIIWWFLYPSKKKEHTYIFPKNSPLFSFMDIKNAIRNVRIGLKSENKLIVQARN